MVDVIALRGAVQTALSTITGATFYDGYVPEKVPTDPAGFVLPYIVLWAGVGDEIPERDLSDLVDLDGLRWDFQTTTVAASAGLCAQVGDVVRRKLTNLPLGSHHVLPNEDGFRQEVPILDQTITPARFMLPHPWRLETT
ncbi:hypothetical protein [Arthrobacter sp. CP30]